MKRRNFLKLVGVACLGSSILLTKSLPVGYIYCPYIPIFRTKKGFSVETNYKIINNGTVRILATALQHRSGDEQGNRKTIKL